jgi:membrane associated rhomboid family serine protease
VIPLRDVIPSRTTPVVTIALIALNIVVFIHELLLSPAALRHFYFTAGLVPASFSWVALVTSMFVHGGYVHIGGNLLTLWIFGDNVEDRMGHLRFLAFYLVAGGLAALGQTWADPSSTVPIIGASGAIAGVMGAYFLLLPRSRILVLIFLFIFIDVVEVPAVFFLGFWFLMQIFGGVGQLGSSGSSASVAFWAHLVGFVSGLIGAWLLARPERRAVEWWG